MPYAIGTWLACGAFFSFLIAGPAQSVPHRAPIRPLDGPGPNPLLQNHVLMIIHPPLLYLGYVGMTIPFGFACAALLRGRLGQSFLRPLRASLMLPWIFLTIAIMLGGWWAYEVLGLGRLLGVGSGRERVAAAVAHRHRRAALAPSSWSAAAMLKGWTVTLVQASFLLTILGTFMTRSGVFNSVHSFTQSAIGPTILVFLAAIAALLGGAARAAHRLARSRGAHRERGEPRGDVPRQQPALRRSSPSRCSSAPSSR